MIKSSKSHEDSFISFTALSIRVRLTCHFLATISTHLMHYQKPLKY
jgi:hypothetical protein